MSNRKYRFDKTDWVIWIFPYKKGKLVWIRDKKNWIKSCHFNEREVFSDE